MSISYGGESAKQQKSNLMKDNPVAKHASAMQMKQPGYMSEDQANKLPPKLKTIPSGLYCLYKSNAFSIKLGSSRAALSCTC